MFQVFPYSTYLLMINEGQPIPSLVGCNCIYPDYLQTILIEVFGGSDFQSDMKKFCFFLDDNIYIHPTYTYDSNVISCPYLFVSDDFYESFFLEKNECNFGMIYNLPMVKRLNLKQVDGEFPKGISIEDLLTIHLESSLIVMKNQKIKLEFENAQFIELVVNEMEYIPESNKERTSIEERLEEFQFRNKFLDLCQSEGIHQKYNVEFCVDNLSIHNFNWYFHKILKEQALKNGWKSFSFETSF